MLLQASLIMSGPAKNTLKMNMSGLALALVLQSSISFDMTAFFQVLFSFFILLFTKEIFRTKTAITAATRNAKLAMFKIKTVNKTVPWIVQGLFNEVEVLLIPSYLNINASTMTKLLLNAVGIEKVMVDSNAKKDDFLLVEALPIQRF